MDVRHFTNEPGNGKWWHFPHQADVGVAAAGYSLQVAFEQIALALTAIVSTAAIEPRLAVQIQCRASSLDDLLVAWLNEVIYEMDCRQCIFGRFSVRINGTELHATAWGEPIDRERHEPAVDVKGATYTALEVRQDEQGLWQLRCVLDV